jgi:hypothetical protein
MSEETTPTPPEEEQAQPTDDQVRQRIVEILQGAADALQGLNTAEVWPKGVGGPHDGLYVPLQTILHGVAANRSETTTIISQVDGREHVYLSPAGEVDFYWQGWITQDDQDVLVENLSTTIGEQHETLDHYSRTQVAMIDLHDELVRDVVDLAKDMLRKSNRDTRTLRALARELLATAEKWDEAHEELLPSATRRN